MIQYLLAVDDNINNYEKHKSNWYKYGIEPERVSSMQAALACLKNKKYLFIGINGDSINYKPLLRIMWDITLSPILLFTSHYSFEEHIEAIRLGADYYMQRQLDSEETTQWSIVILQRLMERKNRSKQMPEFASYRDVFVCPFHRKAFINDAEIDLTTKEFNILFMFITDPLNVFTTEQILLQVWGNDYTEVDIFNLRNTLTRLRKKLKTTPNLYEYIKSVRDIGYAFDR